MLNIKIRMVNLSSSADLKTLWELDERCFLPADASPRNEWMDFESYLLFLGRIPIGFISIREQCRVDAEDQFVTDPESLYLGGIGIIPEYQNRGYASLLMSWLMIYFQESAMKKVFSHIRQSNSASLALHKKFGFRSIGQFPNFYERPNEPAIVLELTKKS